MPRLTKIYTRTGDEGMTGLGGGQRVPKDALRVQSYGTVDELNSHLGLALALGLCDRLAAIVPEIQNGLFDVGTELCFVEEDKKRYPLPQIEECHIRRLEDLIDELNESVGPLENFIWRAARLAAQLQVARTVCRRAERGDGAGAVRGRGSAYADLPQPAV